MAGMSLPIVYDGGVCVHGEKDACSRWRKVPDGEVQNYL